MVLEGKNLIGPTPDAYGNDVLVGGTGADTLVGGSGADLFRFETVGDSSTIAFDRIADFRQAEGDRIDLSALKGTGSLTYIGNGAFSNVAGQIRYSQQGSDTRLLVDMDGDGNGEMVITITGTVTITAGDLVL